MDSPLLNIFLFLLSKHLGNGLTVSHLVLFHAQSSEDFDPAVQDKC